MKKLSSRDLGLNDDFVAEGETDEEVMQKMKEHGQQFHAEEVKKMMETMSEEEMIAMMKSKIKEE